MVSRDLSAADLELFKIQRHQLMVGLYVVGVVNGLTAGVYQAFHRQSLAEAALNLFDVNVVVLLATAIGISLAWRSCDRVTRGADLVVAVLFAAMIIVPDGRVSWIALRACLTDFPSRLLRSGERRSRCGQIRTVRNRTVRNTRIMEAAIRAI